MPQSLPAPYLKRFAAALGITFVVFLTAFGWQSWLTSKESQLEDLQSVLQLTERSLDRYFLQIQASLAGLDIEIQSVGGLTDLPRTHGLLQRYQRRHPELASVNLLSLDGHFLATSQPTTRVENLPSVTDQSPVPSMRNYRAELSTMRPEAPLELAIPIRGPITRQWVTPMRYLMRDAHGQPLAVISAAAPVEMLQTFWSKAPIVTKAAVGLIRDDGYLISRFPVPDDASPDQLYGTPRGGSLQLHLTAEQHPASGYMEGPNALSGRISATLYQRLEHFPVTLFITMPVAEYWKVWWSQMQVPLFLTLLLLSSVGLGLRYTLNQDKRWHGERQRASAELARVLHALENSEKRAHAELNDQSECICRLRADGIVLFVNDAFCHIFGIERSALVGKLWQEIRYLPDVPMVEAKLRTLSPENPRVEIENQVVTVAGLRLFRWLNTGTFDADGQLLDFQSVGRDVTERREMQARLEALHSEFEDLYDHAPCGYYSVDTEGAILQMNRTGLNWLGRTRDEVVGKMNVIDLWLTPEGQATCRDTFPKFLEQGYIDNVEFDLVSTTGQVRRVALSATAEKDAEGCILRSRTVMYDITELHQARLQSTALTHELNTMLDNEMVGIFKLRDRRIVWYNKGIQRLLGYQPEELLGRSTRVLYPDDESYAAIGQARQAMVSEDKPFQRQVQLIRKDGEILWMDVSGTLLSTETQESLWIVSDITPLKTQQLMQEHFATHDALTGLANRSLLMDRLHQSLALAGRRRDLIALCFMDLDGFKPVNDEMGHAAGDTVLKAVARRLSSCARANDTVARLGGDEFVLMLTDLQNLEQIDSVLTRALATINAPIDLDDGRSVQVAASVGVAVYPDHAREPEELLHLADLAMYRAKQQKNGKICYVETDQQPG